MGLKMSFHFQSLKGFVSPKQDFNRRTLGIREELKVGKNEGEEEAKVLKRAKKSAAPSTPKSLFMRAVE